MKKLFILLILLASVIIAAGCTGKGPGNSVGGPESPTGENETLTVPGGMQNNSTTSQGSQVNSTVVEVTQLEQINAALQKGPVFLKIGAEWCEPCQEMKPILKDLATEYAGKATIMSVDVDKSPKLTDYFGVGSIPDSSVIVGFENNEYFYMQEDGNVNKDRFQARILGLREKQELEKVIDLALQKGNVKSA